ncbi:MAG TPA: thioesterase domain-containing protein [Gammaproteobacteria bacterium]|nr:thioesterase domain-containing protein [Gammaproteobacteria bacterium]
MPFQLFRNNSSADTSSPSLYLIPGILGNSIELLRIAEDLQQYYHCNRIYLYHDPRLIQSDHPFAQKYTLDLHAKEIMQGIMDTQPAHASFLLAGYSYGCTLAIKTAQMFNDEYHSHTLLMIDAPAPTLYKKYFCKTNQSFIEDIISILNYAAILSGIESMQFTQKQLNNLLDDNIDRCLSQLAEQFLPPQRQTKFPITEEKKVTFLQYVHIAIQNLSSLMNEKPDNHFTKVNEINVLLTANTLEKYQPYSKDENVGWKEYAKKITSISHTQLKEAEHIELVSKHYTQMAEVIYNTLNPHNRVTKKEMAEAILSLMFRDPTKKRSSQDCQSDDEEQLYSLNLFNLIPTRNTGKNSNKDRQFKIVPPVIIRAKSKGKAEIDDLQSPPSCKLFKQYRHLQASHDNTSHKSKRMKLQKTMA